MDNKPMQTEDRNEDILVSIICTAYNHEKYISYAVDGFLMQETNFKYEILINDDTSTDNTAKILKEYQKNFPNLLRVFYQKENQYSKGIDVTNILLKEARGKYLAFCEGDDYWIDKNKLQKQVDFLQQNKSYSAVVHNTITVNEFNKVFIEEQHCFPLCGNYTIKRAAALPDHLLGQLGTIVCVNYWRLLINKNGEEFIKFYNQELPTGAGDTKLTLLLNQIGDMYHMQDIMSCYRRTYFGSSYNAKVHNVDLSKAYYDSITILDKIMQNIFKKKPNVTGIVLAQNILVGDYLIKFLSSLKINDLKIFVRLFCYHKNKVSFIFQFSNRVLKKLFNLNFLALHPIDKEYFKEFKKRRKGYEF